MQPPDTYTRQASKGLGGLSEMITPTGASVKYTYSRDENYIYIFNADDIPRETVRKKTVTHDGTSEEWNYDIFEFNACGGTVTGPDGSVTAESCEPRDSGYGNYSMSNPKGGLVFRTRNSDKILVERHWALMKFNGGNGMATGGYGEIPFNPVVDAEYTTLLEGNPAQAVKMSAKTFQYDFNGNLISQTEYDWFDPTGIPRDAAGVPTGVPAGATVLRVTNNAYYNDSTSAYSTNVYAKRAWGATPLILNAPQQSSVGPAITQMSYDGQPYGSPPTAGNVTRKSAWNNIANQWIDVEKTYGPYGNLASITDGRGNFTQFFYDDATHARPTRVIVDPENGTGTQTTFTAYDYHTGLVTSTTDANNNTSTINYTNQLLGTIDPFGRPGVASGPVVNVDGVNQRRQTKTIYEDNARTVTVLSDLRSEGDGLVKSQTISDMLGRPIETRQYENASQFITVRKSYDIPNRLSRTSNPFRAGEALVWTTTVKDVLGRVISVTTPDNAVVATAYYGERILITDQAGKQRISSTNAMGKPKDMWEVTAPDAATESISFSSHPEIVAGYRTSYGYDALGNLIAVNHGGQTRTFVYDSLKRLVSTTNPESGTVCYGAVVNEQCQYNGYDNAGNLTKKTDARGVVTNYAYDALNRVTSRSYQNDPTNTPTVTYTYDTATNGKERLASVSSSLSTYSYSGYDAMGRGLGATQTVGGQSYVLSYTYELAGHVKTVTYPSGRSVTNGYDDAGRLNSFTGYLGDGTQRTYASGISYSSFGGPQQEQLGTSTPLYHKRHYNVRGQLYDVRVSTLAWAQDEFNWNRGAVVLHYGGAPWGQSSTTNNGNLTMQQHWAPLNEALSNYVYTQQSYTYDSLNRLTSVSELHGGPSGQSGIDYVQAYDYDRFGNRRISLGGTSGGVNNLQTWIDPNNNRLYAPGDQNITDPEQRLVRYDAAGNQKADYYSPNWNGTRTFDAENRMKSATTTANVTSTYVYDGEGRRIKRIVSGIETWQVFGLGGELMAEYAQNGTPTNPQKEYGYRNGELLIAATATSGWGTPPTLTDNPLVVNQTEVKAQHITELRNAINSVRSHVSQSAYSWQYSATTSDYINANPILEMRTALDQALGAGTYATGLAQGQPVKAVHIQELRDRVLAAWQSGGGVNIRWMVSDHLGTPRMIFDQSGSLANVSRHDYLPFGEELYAATGGRTTSLGYSVNDGVRQKFTSKERDAETDLDYFVARYYGSITGRFISPDPLLASGSVDDPQSWNRYAYTQNNPLRRIDPTGLWDWDVSAGGSYTDDQLRARQNDKSLKDKDRKAAKRALEFRQRFRAARAAAQTAASNSQLTQKQQQQVSESVASYGSENDGNGVNVGVRDSAAGTAAVTMLNEDDTITVMFNNNLKGDKLTAVFAHEGRHVGDAQSWVQDYHCAFCPSNLNHYERETRAWNVSSYVAQALNMGSYAPGGAESDYEVWNKGWKAADRETKRSRGVERIVSRLYSLKSTDTDRYTSEHQHMPPQ